MHSRWFSLCRRKGKFAYPRKVDGAVFESSKYRFSVLKTYGLGDFLETLTHTIMIHSCPKIQTGRHVRGIFSVLNTMIYIHISCHLMCTSTVLQYCQHPFSITTAVKRCCVQDICCVAWFVQNAFLCQT